MATVLLNLLYQVSVKDPYQYKPKTWNGPDSCQLVSMYLPLGRFYLLNFRTSLESLISYE